MLRTKTSWARLALHPLTFLLLAFFCNTLLWACIIEPGARRMNGIILIMFAPQVWRPDKSDGVEFVVRIEAADGHHELLRRYIDPKSRPEDRRWNDITIDLSAYGGQSVQLTLLALPGRRWALRLGRVGEAYDRL